MDRFVDPSRVPEDLLRPLVAYFDPRRVILFGSHARDEADADSDYDLLVVVADDTPPERFSWRARHEARKSFHGAADILLCRESVFVEKARHPVTSAHAIATEGVVVYEQW